LTALATGSVTLIMPTYNEARFVAQCLESVVEDGHTQVLVVDGGSTDATRDIVTALMPRMPGLRLLDNPQRTAATAMNLGLAHATGEVIVRIDAHSVYPPGYVQRLKAALEEHSADVSGGVVVSIPRTGTVFGRAVAASLTNPWVMGNAGFRLGGGQVRVVDTVPFGCWRAETLRRAGGYNEELHRSQDYDLSQRLKQLGAKIVLVPDVVIEYQARSQLGENVRYQFWNGFWVGYPMVANGVRFAARHLAPAVATVLGVVVLGASAVLVSPWPLLLVAPYLVILVLSGVAAADKGLAVALHLPLVTAATHVLYGLGTLYGLWKGAIVRFARGPRTREGAGPRTTAA
jgi:glycosyltransferase involved in cell wall biosynthesis